jgi:NAD(P)-dependent dehydrogenase (short-subunit alcohol dehydrogenase family)
MTNDLQGKVVLVTGATDGLGRASALALARRGATVLAHGRDTEKGEALVAMLTKEGAQVARFYRADFASLKDVSAFADQVLTAESRLDVLINNAGLGVEDQRRESDDGYEMLFAVDYLAPYLLTHRLTDLLARSSPARVVNVASAGQSAINFDDVMLESSWSGVQSYCQAKLALVMMAFDIADRLRDRGVTINALHPASMMPTKIVVGRYGPQSSIEDGVRNLLRLAIDPTLQGVTGRYFDRGDEGRADNQAYDAAARAELRALSDQLCKTALQSEEV